MRLNDRLSVDLSCFLRKDSGASFSECALVASIVIVVGVIALIAWQKAWG
jgi:Tfp pilus assembly protein PilV